MPFTLESGSRSHYNGWDSITTNREPPCRPQKTVVFFFTWDPTIGSLTFAEIPV